MGYTKVVQYGDITEIYTYERDRRNYKRKQLSPLIGATNKERKQATDNLFKWGLRKRKEKLPRYRTNRSMVRSRQAFFRFVHANVCASKTVHFLTLTFAYDITYKKATRALARFMERTKKASGTISPSYISVPELTKKNRFHFHILVFNLPPEVSGDSISIRKYNRRKGRWEVESATTERITRNLQRQFHYGYVDICPTTYHSEGIAGYMAKYMAKALADEKNEAWRGYNCSRNVAKVFSHGGNTLDREMDLMIPDLIDTSEVTKYNTPYMGICTRLKIKKRP